MKILETLHDYNPKLKFNKNLKRLAFFWVLLSVTLIFLEIMSAYSEAYRNVSIRIISIILSSVLLLLFILLIILAWFGSLVFLYDGNEYTTFIKRDLEFIPFGDYAIRAYIYIPEEHLDAVISGSIKLPTIIGVHGWGGHHRRMDRYCLPFAQQERALYFTYDVRGHGASPGDRNDLKHAFETREFIDAVIAMPCVEKRKIFIVGMSIGAAKVASFGYPNSNIRGVALISGAYDLFLTLKKMTLFFRIAFRLLGYKIPDDDRLKNYSAIYFFNKKGIKLEGETRKRENRERVILLAAADDKMVVPENTLKAAQLLDLPKENVKIYPDGMHMIFGHDWDMSAFIYKFFRKCLDEK